jgi:hypothetical protein
MNDSLVTLVIGYTHSGTLKRRGRNSPNFGVTHLGSISAFTQPPRPDMGLVYHTQMITPAFS